MTWRRQLPAWSPVTLRAIIAGATASRRGSRRLGALETRIRSEYGASSVRLMESGTSALALAMLASAPDGGRPRVALPAWACYDLMTAADMADADVVLYDLDAATLAPSPGSFSDALRTRPSAVVVAHWFGLPVALAPLLAATHGAGAMFIEDAAQGVGASIGARPLGSLGDFGILSFGRGKGRTGGRGGALLANTPSAAAQLERVARYVAPADASMRGLVALFAQWAVGRPSLYAIPASIPSLKLGETIYHAPGPLRGMAEWSAAVVGELWDRSAAESTLRRDAGARWAAQTASLAHLRSFAEPRGSAAGWLRYPVLAEDPGAYLDASARELGIMPGYQRLLADLPLAPGRLVNLGPWPGAADIAARLRTLPSHSLLRAGDVAAIVHLLGRAGERHS